MSRLSRLWLDVSPIRDSAAYRRLWAGDLVAAAGSQFAAVALPYQVYRLTYKFSYGLLALTVFDLLVVWLTWREYVIKRAARATPIGAPA